MRAQINGQHVLYLWLSNLFPHCDLMYAKWLTPAVFHCFAQYRICVVHCWRQKRDICVLTLCPNGGGDIYIASKFAPLNETWNTGSVQFIWNLKFEIIWNLFKICFTEWNRHRQCGRNGLFYSRKHPTVCDVLFVVV